ncbi:MULTISPECIES: IS66 family insertion sequence element accessory protein TnpB [Lelliottia]|uniref:IS66 family insertion sequence element accessory protein TnpB n=1 Tax=Lelliottia TaxID=1330545 RepID=UPI00192C3510|nr:IS66 family insertion sequence element accessory protein TnpB [Lelliottia aquatilis]MBL5932718.1 IS66 family insertion sequence element accessory protein TnpB [Lelliottia amnigena]
MVSGIPYVRPRLHLPGKLWQSWSACDGLCLLSIRLECGRFALLSACDGKVFLTQVQLAKLIEGIDLRQPKRLLTSLTIL